MWLRKDWVVSVDEVSGVTEMAEVPTNIVERNPLDKASMRGVRREPLRRANGVFDQPQPNTDHPVGVNNGLSRSVSIHIATRSSEGMISPYYDRRR